MRMIKPLMTAAALALPVAAQASPPMPRETIAAIGAALSECTGGWYASGSWTLVKPADLLPRTELLARPSIELADDAGMDLYKIAKGLLFPATGSQEWIPDGTSSSLKCPARPVEAVALMEYLVGEGPDDRRGATNAFDWLGLAYQTGVAGQVDPVQARRYLLRGRMHSAILVNDRWSDGIDHDPLGNIERAGMRPYLEALAATEHGGAARMILAEEALPTDPARARVLLRTLYTPALNRLLELEDAGRVPTVADAEDIAFWAEAWRTQLGFKTWGRRMLKGALLANGGVVPTAPVRPRIDELRRYLDTDIVADASATRVPMPVRALVDPRGQAIYIEACRASTLNGSRSASEDGARLDAGRLYNHTVLPKLPVATIDGRPVYGWVILPAVQFQRPQPDKLEFAFSDLPAESCVYSDILDSQITPAPPPSPRPAR